MSERTLVCQLWMESEYEPGWGTTQRSDGFSLHLNNADRSAYIKQHNDSLPSKLPSIYSFAIGNGYLVDLPEEIYEVVKSYPLGKRGYGKPPEQV